MLYLISTPIGSLGDFSYRAVEVIGELDLLLCEDTRHTEILLKHYKLSVPLKSYHRLTEAKWEESIIADLKMGKQIGLVSDAGTPGISDPGERLVSRCRDENLPVTAIPGPCAAINALVISGAPTAPFQFVGFLPKNPRRALVEILHYRGTTVAYESPARLGKTLDLFEELAPEHAIAIARELTKRYEELIRGIPSELPRKWKGEIVLIIPPYKQRWETLGPRDHIELVEKEYGIERKEALKLVAYLRGIPKRELYGQDIGS